METLNSILAAGAAWYAKLKGAVETIQAVWAGVAAIATAHPELEADVHTAFVDVINGLQTKSPMGILATVNDVKKAYTDFTIAYTGEKAALLVLLSKLQSIAS